MTFYSLERFYLGLHRLTGAPCFLLNSASITRGNGYKLFGKISRVNIRHHYFCNRVVTVWNNLPATDVNFKSFRAFKTFFVEH